MNRRGFLTAAATVPIVAAMPAAGEPVVAAELVSCAALAGDGTYAIWLISFQEGRVSRGAFFDNLKAQGLVNVRADGSLS